jgi:nucleoid-associated protein YgaU
MKKSLIAILITSFLGINSNIQAAEVEDKKAIAKEFEYKTSDKIPEGFEDLINSINYGFIDIYFANRYLGSFQSEYNSSDLTLFDPEEIFKLLKKEVTFHNPEEIKIILEKPLPLNSGFNCLNDKICDKFTPEKIGIVFDDSTLSAKIYLNYDEIQEAEFDYTTLLAPSTSYNSFIQSLDLNFYGGTSAAETEYSLSGGTYLAHKEHRIKSNWIKSQDNFYFNQLYYGTDYKGYKIKAGYITSDSFGYTFTPSFRMLGFEYGTSVNTRKDLQTEFSEPMHVFLNQRAAIKITRGNELVYTAYHEAGNQMIPTDNFPSGSYNVDIEIIEDDGNKRKMNKFFVKSISIPPEDENIFYINAGLMEKDSFEEEDDDFLSIFSETQNEMDLFPESDDEGFVKIGNANRWNSQTALYNEILYKKSDYLYNPTLYFLGNGYDLKTSLLYGSNDAEGITIDFNLPYNEHNFSFFGRYVKENSNSLVFGEGTSITAAYNVNLFDYGSLSLFTSYDKSAVTDVDNTTYSLGYRNNIYQNSNSSINFNFDVSKNDLETFLNVGFTYYFNSPNNWSLKTSPSWQKQGDVQDYRLNNSFRVSGENSKNTQWHANVNTNNSKNSRNVLLNTSVSDQRYGSANIDVNHDYFDGSKTTYIGNVTTNIVSDSENIAIGGKRRLESGIIIDLTEYKKEDDFELYINEIPTDYIKSNKETFIPLEPYKEYNMYLKSKSTDNFIQVKRKSDFVVPYPGNVQSLSWEINRISILSTQLVDEFGNIIKSNPVYIDSNKTYTDEFGFFQIEVIETDKRLWTTVNEKECVTDLTEIMNEDIVYKEEIICYYSEEVQEYEVAPEIESQPILTLAGVPQKDISESINGKYIDITKNDNSCYNPYKSMEYTIAKNDTIANIVRNTVVEKNSPYLEISPIIKDIVKCNNLVTPDNITIDEVILIPDFRNESKDDKGSSFNLPIPVPFILPIPLAIVTPLILPSIPSFDMNFSNDKSCYDGFDKKEHTVSQTDTLSEISRDILGNKSNYKDITKLVNNIAHCNKNISHPDLLVNGETIIIPSLPLVATIPVLPLPLDIGVYPKGDNQCYIVKKGDWLHKISRKFTPKGLSFKDMQKMVLLIVKENNIDNPNVIEIGDEICIPDYKLIKDIDINKTKINDLPNKKVNKIIVEPQTTRLSLIKDITSLLITEHYISQGEVERFMLYLKLKIPKNLKAWDNIRDYEIIIYTKFNDFCIKLSELNGEFTYVIEKENKNVVKQVTPDNVKHLNGVINKGNNQCYVVKKGDWLHKISRKFITKNMNFIDMQKMVMLISKENNINNPNEIDIDDEICISNPLDIKNIERHKTKISKLSNKKINNIIEPATTKKTLIKKITTFVINEKLIKKEEEKLFILYLNIKIPDNLKAWDNLNDYDIVLDTTFKDLCIQSSKLKGKILFTINEEKETKKNLHKQVLNENIFLTN